MHEVAMRIGEVARRAGVRVSLIRCYEDVGLLPAPPRVSGQRRYDERVLRSVAVIDVAQRAGPSLREIRDLVEHGDDPVSDQRVREWLVTAQDCRCQATDECRLFDGAPA